MSVFCGITNHILKLVQAGISVTLETMGFEQLSLCDPRFRMIVVGDPWLKQGLLYLSDDISFLKIVNLPSTRQKKYRVMYSDGLWAGWPGFDSHQVKGFSLLSNAQNDFRAPPSLLFNGFRRQSGRAVELTTNLHLVPRSRMVELYLHAL
jgi:hypothetical protein